MIQQIKQSTVKCLHDTDGGDKKYKRKRKKGARCKVHVYDGVNCCVIGNVLNGF